MFPREVTIASILCVRYLGLLPLPHLFETTALALAWQAAGAIVWQSLPKISLFSQHDHRVTGNIICGLSSCFHLWGGGKQMPNSQMHFRAGEST